MIWSCVVRIMIIDDGMVECRILFGEGVVGLAVWAGYVKPAVTLGVLHDLHACIKVYRW